MSKDFKVKNGIKPTAYHEAVGTVVSSTENVGPVGVFSTTLYSGTGSDQVVTTGIDLANDGGLLWIKNRDNTNSNWLLDSERSNFTSRLNTNLTAAEAVDSGAYVEVSSTGFTTKGNDANINATTYGYVSWSFKQEPNFFDVVTYVGTGASNTITHNLGVEPGFIIVKRRNSTNTWTCYHKERGSGKWFDLADTASEYSSTTAWDNTSPTSTNFSVGNFGGTNQLGGTYVAYVFAHDTSVDSMIKCISYTGDGGTAHNIDLGWKPQWLLFKNASNSGTPTNWQVYDAERGIPDGTGDKYLRPNDTSAESSVSYIDLSDTGFTLTNNSVQINQSGDTYICVAIRESVITPIRTLDLSTGSVFEITPTSDIQINLSNPAASGTVSQATLLLDRSVEASGDLLFFAADAGNSSNYDDADGWTTIIDIANQTDPDTNFYLVRQTAATDGTYDISFATNNSNALPSGGAFMCANGATYQGVSQGSGSVSFSSGLTVGESVLFLVESGDASNTTYTPPTGYTVLFESTGTETTLTHTVVSYKIADATSDSPAAGNFSSGGSYRALVHVRNAGTAATANDILAQVQKVTAVTSTFTVDDGQVAYIYSEPTITYDTTLQWGGGTAPDSPALGETDVLTFSTRDGGTTYQAVAAIQGAK